jgi:hypothetical protein
MKAFVTYWIIINSVAKANFINSISFKNYLAYIYLKVVGIYCVISRYTLCRKLLSPV